MLQRSKYGHAVATLADPNFEIDVNPAPEVIGFVQGERGDIGMRVYHVDLASGTLRGITIFARHALLNAPAELGQ